MHFGRCKGRQYSVHMDPIIVICSTSVSQCFMNFKCDLLLEQYKVSYSFLFLHCLEFILNKMLNNIGLFVNGEAVKRPIITCIYITSAVFFYETFIFNSYLHNQISVKALFPSEALSSVLKTNVFGNVLFGSYRF